MRLPFAYANRRLNRGEKLFLPKLRARAVKRIIDPLLAFRATVFFHHAALLVGHFEYLVEPMTDYGDYYNPPHNAQVNQLGDNSGALDL
jgi:hypothetical protein